MEEDVEADAGDAGVEDADDLEIGTLRTLRSNDDINGCGGL